MIARRTFLWGLTLGMLSAPLAAEAQEAGRVYRIGYLGDMPGPFTAAFRQSLHEVGYFEGQNLAIEYRWAEGKRERLSVLAAELARLPVDVLIAAGAEAARAAKQATRTIPIVAAHVGDPVGSGLVASLKRPGGNITGVSVMGVELSGKQLALLKEAAPRISRVAVLLNPTNPGAEQSFRVMESAARAQTLTLRRVEARNAEALERALVSLSPAQVDALFVLQDPLFFSHRSRIIDSVAQNRLPAVYMYREWADAGGFMTYGASLREVYGRVADLVDKILRGTNTADLPVEQITRIELVINSRAAKTLGLTLPPSLLVRADQVIE